MSDKEPSLEYLRGAHDGIEVARRLVLLKRAERTSTQTGLEMLEQIMGLLDVAQEHAKEDADSAAGTPEASAAPESDSEVIEVVAKALYYAATGSDDDNWPGTHESDRESFRDSARVAIGAYRETQAAVLESLRQRVVMGEGASESSEAS